MLKKLTSRKFLACIAGTVIGLCTAFGLDTHLVMQISGIVVSAVSLVTYIVTEGRIDRAAADRAQALLDAVSDALAEDGPDGQAGCSISKS